MASHDDIIQRMTRSNPLPDVAMITDGQLAELTLQIEKSRCDGQTVAQPHELIPTRPPIRWLRPAVAFAAALLVAFAVISAVSVTTGGESDMANQSISTPAIVVTDAWNPLLATAMAGAAPQPAACPGGSGATTPGPPGQMRPMPRNDAHDGVFDRHLGRVVYVDAAHQTWTFDVCTNTWHQMGAVGDPLDTSLVYDVDSDVTIALGPGEFSVYDAAANAWTKPQLEVRGGPRPDSFSGVTYDPMSGLIITTSGSRVWAFDVDSGTLTHIGTAPAEFAGYVAHLDRLVFVGADTVLVDPRTGETTQTAQPPELGPFSAYDFFEADGTVFASASTADGAAPGICGFDPATLAWTRCFDAHSVDLGSFSSRVEDSINSRVILIQSDSLRHDMWAFDLKTEELTEIVPYAPVRFQTED
ncbi:MAG: hypothetical protein GY788_30715 [bacterium]|nr:hypothetical protein [bacterium]